MSTRVENKVLKNAYLNRHNFYMVIEVEGEEFCILNKGSNIDFLANVQERREEEGEEFFPFFIKRENNLPYEGGYLAGRFSARNAARRRYNRAQT